MKKFLLFAISAGLLVSFTPEAYQAHQAQKNWVDSVFHSLTPDQKIAQLMVLRAHSNLGPDHVAALSETISKYNPGALCFFQGGPVRQANLTNLYQSLAQTPLMITIDGEWGLGMRLDSVEKFPYQLTLGALNNEQLVYQMGEAIGKQMKRIGVHVNYAPVVDINNNPDNPVIGYRSFGENKDKVARMGIAYMQGMQKMGVMACAKHFPGHGDVAVDSHFDLPIINKSMDQLEETELYPFKQLIKAGVGSVMTAHLSIPAIDTTTNQPTSLSKKSVTGVLKDDLDFDGLIFTDALEMKGVAKFYPSGEAAVQALIAGNDMLCLPESVPQTLEAVNKAIKDKRLKWKQIDEKVKKVLTAKYQLGLNTKQFVDTTNLLQDINEATAAIRTKVAENTVTVMRNESAVLPLMNSARVAYVALGADSTVIGSRLAKEMHADGYYLPYGAPVESAAKILQSVRDGKYSKVLIGLHNYSMRPANSYGISTPARMLWDSLQSANTATLLFGNVYAATQFPAASTLVSFYQDDEITENAAADFLEGKIASRGTLPVTVNQIPFGSGVMINRFQPAGMSAQWLNVDSIVRDGLARKAYPGCVVLAVRNGEIVYHKAFGNTDFLPGAQPVTLESVYDLASVTKVSATTVSLMKLYDQGKLSLDDELGKFLDFTRGTDKEHLKISEILLHQAGLNPGISFYRETLDANGMPSPTFYRDQPDTLYSVPVAQKLWLRKDFNNVMLQRIAESKLTEEGKYVYSDNDFILLGKIVESISGMPLDQYAARNFYIPMGMNSTGFNPWRTMGLERVVPTEEDRYFRRQVLRSYVHDEGAAMFGGVSGHAGLFSNAYDLSKLYQMLLNGGSFNGHQYLKPETIELFTGYHSDISRRGYGFDKPEKDNATRKEPYPSAFASPMTFGHTGFTGTCVWADPANGMVYVFLSNRVNATRTNNLLGSMSIRGKVQDAMYKAIKADDQLRASRTLTPGFTGSTK